MKTAPKSHLISYLFENQMTLFCCVRRGLGFR